MFETGRMAPILFHGVEPAWSARSLRGEPAGLPCAQSLATHKTDRNDARGLAHLARTGFFKPVHVKSLSAHSLRSLIILFGLSSQAVSVWGNRLRRQHLEMRRPADAGSAVRSRQCHADPLQRPTQTQGLGLRYAVSTILADTDAPPEPAFLV
jgi:hypothetical protein